MIVDGKKIAEKMEHELSGKLAELREKGEPQKKVAFVLFGDNFASRKFMGMKKKLADRVGIDATIFEKEVATTEEAVLFIQSLASEKSGAENYDGIVVQLPVPAHLDAEKIVSVIPINKDVDLLSENAMAAYRSNKNNLVPPVARAVWEILKQHNIDLKNVSGKNILVIGNGKLVGAPVAAMFEREGIIFKQVRRSTPAEERLAEIKNADIIISGVGEPHFITPDMVKDGVVLIDAGTSEQAGKLAGDIDPACAEKATLFTPVPGGVGPVTVVSLFWNLI